MSKYNVKDSNETTQTVSIKKYGSTSKEDMIVAANPAIGSIASGSLFLPVGMILNIPDDSVKKGKVKPKEIPVTPQPESVNNEDQPIENEEVSLVIDGVLFKFWQNCSITFPIDSFRTFSLSCPFQHMDENWKTIFQPFKYQECVLYIGGVKVITSSMIKQTRNSKSNSCTITVEGYSKPGVLNDVSISSSAWPLSFNGLDLKQISEKLCKPLGINVVFESDQGSAFKNSDKIEVDPEKKIFDLLIDLATQRNLIISDDENGNLVFKKSTIERATYSLIDGQYPVESCDITFDGQPRYSDITVLNSNRKSGSGSKYIISDNELKRNGINRQMVVKQDDIDTGGIKQAAQSQWGRTLSASVNGSIDIIGWRTPEKKLFYPNTQFIFDSPQCGIYRSTEFLIKNVQYTKNPGSITANLSIILPESYGDTQPESMPWE